MSRSAWKLPYISLILFQKRFLNKKNMNIKFRNSIIPSIFIEKKIKLSVFNGVWFRSIIMSNNMLGTRFGEFSFTKICDRQTHLKRKRKKKTKGKK